MVDERIVASGAETPDAWKQISCLLFDTSAGPSLPAIQERLQETSSARQADSASPQVLIDAAALAHSIDRYSRQLQQQVSMEREASRGLLSALLDHLEYVHTDAVEVAQLAQVRSHLETGHPEDPEQRRQLLMECLASLRQGYQDRERANDALLASHRDRIQRLEPSGPLSSSSAGVAPAQAVVSDPCTGLPAKSEAEAALQRVAGNSQSYIAVFYVHRMSLINARFGEEIGNEILVYCSQHIATTLIRPKDLLFRWSGPVFVAILERDESAPAVAGEVRRVVSAPLSRFFDNSSRTMYLPIRLTAETFAAANQEYASLAEQISHFILCSSQVG